MNDKPEGKLARGRMKQKKEPVPRRVAHFDGLVDLALDGDKVVFLILGDDGLEMATSKKIGDEVCLPPGREVLPFDLPRADAVTRAYNEEDADLFDDLLTYLRRFSYLPEEQWVIVAAKVLLTYLADHSDIHYLPMVLFYAVPERGKSRTGKAVTLVSYRAVHVVDMREANLFRFAENLRSTLFFDLMDIWKKAERNGCEDILLLRYEKGAKVSRVLYPDRGAFRDMVHYDVFGATFMASNVPVHHILDSRCIGITMPNRPGDYEPPSVEKARPLRERLTAWRARMMQRSLPTVSSVPGLRGRLWDISAPLLQVVKIVSSDHLDMLTGALLEVAGQRRDDKRESAEGKIVAIISELAPEGLEEWEVRTADILETFNIDRPEGHKVSGQWLGKKLTALSLPSRKAHGEKVRRVDRETLTILEEQYGLRTLPPISPISPKSPDGEKSGVYTGDSAEDSGELSPHCPRPQRREESASGDNGDSGDSYRKILPIQDDKGKCGACSKDG